MGQVKNMSAFILLFVSAVVLVGIPLGILCLINRLRRKKTGCAGNHECVVYKGERITCPSCDQREYDAEQSKED